jgi:hypothetical protein
MVEGIGQKPSDQLAISQQPTGKLMSTQIHAARGNTEFENAITKDLAL